MDALSDVPSLLKLRSYMSGGFDMGGELSVRFVSVARLTDIRIIEYD